MTTLYCLGDSLTFGAGVRTSEKWTSLVASERLRTVNLGVPGDTTAGMLARLQKLLPEAKGRTYTECDIDTLGASKRGAKRIVFSNDGLIYYTDDHYESFELLYGEE
mgnify:CR=1 FL=1